MHRPVRCGAVAAISIAALAVPLSAQCQTALTGSGTSLDDFFGQSMAMQDDRVLVGAPHQGGDDLGAAYVFRRSGLDWTESAMLTAPGGENFDRFGFSVALEGATAVVGAISADSPIADNAGMVYVYTNLGGNNWPLLTTLYALDAQAGDQFGRSVAIDGDYIYVGAPDEDNDNGFQAGAVYVFRRTAGDQWQFYLKLTASDGVAGDRFGYAVAADNGNAAISAWYADTGGINSTGAVYAFSRQVDGSHSEDARLSAPDAYPNAGFGEYLAVYNNRIAIPDRLFAFNGVHQAGKVYLVQKVNSTWTFMDSDSPTPVVQQSFWGSSVAMDANNIAIGGTSIGGSVGAVAVFTIDAGTGQLSQRLRYTDPSTAGFDRFGRSVGIANDRLAVGDDHHSPEDHPDQGNVVVFNLLDLGADHCAGAPTLAEGFTYDGCTSGALASGNGPSCGQSAASPDAFYAFTPSCTGVYSITTDGSRFDTVLSIHSACPASAANAVACNDDIDGANNRNSRITPALQAGQTYFIRVAGYQGASGSFSLSANSQIAPPPNDACAGAITVTVGATAITTCGSTYQASTNAACTYGYDDAWFRIVSPASGVMTIDVCSSNFDPTLDVWMGGCERMGDPPLVCSDDSCGLGPRVELQAQAGSQYLIRVASWGGRPGGSGTLNIQFGSPCACDWNNSGELNSQDFFDFLTAFFAANADYNQDGSTNSQDFFDFLTCFFAGC